MAAERRYNPFELVGVVLLVLLAFASFFISFLLAPIAVLGLFYFILAVTDRAKQNGNGNGNGHATKPPPPEREPPLERRPASPEQTTPPPAPSSRPYGQPTQPGASDPQRRQPV